MLDDAGASKRHVVKFQTRAQQQTYLECFASLYVGRNLDTNSHRHCSWFQEKVTGRLVLPKHAAASRPAMLFLLAA